MPVSEVLRNIETDIARDTVAPDVEMLTVTLQSTSLDENVLSNFITTLQREPAFESARFRVSRPSTSLAYESASADADKPGDTAASEAADSHSARLPISHLSNARSYESLPSGAGSVKDADTDALGTARPAQEANGETGDCDGSEAGSCGSALTLRPLTYFGRALAAVLRVLRCLFPIRPCSSTPANDALGAQAPGEIELDVLGRLQPHGQAN